MSAKKTSLGENPGSDDSTSQADEAQELFSIGSSDDVDLLQELLKSESDSSSEFDSVQVEMEKPGEVTKLMDSISIEDMEALTNKPGSIDDTAIISETTNESKQEFNQALGQSQDEEAALLDSILSDDEDTDVEHEDSHDEYDLDSTINELESILSQSTDSDFLLLSDLEKENKVGSVISRVEELWAELAEIWPAIRKQPLIASKIEELWNTLKQVSENNSDVLPSLDSLMSMTPGSLDSEYNISSDMNNNIVTSGADSAGTPVTTYGPEVSGNNNWVEDDVLGNIIDDILGGDAGSLPEENNVVPLFDEKLDDDMQDIYTKSDSVASETTDYSTLEQELLANNDVSSLSNDWSSAADSQTVDEDIINNASQSFSSENEHDELLKDILGASGNDTDRDAGVSTILADNENIEEASSYSVDDDYVSQQNNPGTVDGDLDDDKIIQDILRQYEDKTEGSDYENSSLYNNDSHTGQELEEDDLSSYKTSEDNETGSSESILNSILDEGVSDSDIDGHDDIVQSSIDTTNEFIVDEDLKSILEGVEHNSPEDEVDDQYIQPSTTADSELDTKSLNTPKIVPSRSEVDSKATVTAFVNTAETKSAYDMQRDEASASKRHFLVASLVLAMAILLTYFFTGSDEKLETVSVYDRQISGVDKYRDETPVDVEEEEGINDIANHMGEVEIAPVDVYQEPVVESSIDYLDTPTPVVMPETTAQVEEQVLPAEHQSQATGASVPVEDVAGDNSNELLVANDEKQHAMNERIRQLETQISELQQNQASGSPASALPLQNINDHLNRIDARITDLKEQQKTQSPFVSPRLEAMSETIRKLETLVTDLQVKTSNQGAARENEKQAVAENINQLRTSITELQQKQAIVVPAPANEQKLNELTEHVNRLDVGIAELRLKQSLVNGTDPAAKTSTTALTPEQSARLIEKPLNTLMQSTEQKYQQLSLRIDQLEAILPKLKNANSTQTIAGPPGPVGPQGPVGLTGPAGPAGSVSQSAITGSQEKVSLQGNDSRVQALTDRIHNLETSLQQALDNPRPLKIVQDEEKPFKARVVQDEKGITIILSSPGKTPGASLTNENIFSNTKYEVKTPGPNDSIDTTRPYRQIVHIVVKGDTLWDIAQRYVHDPFLYPELANLSNIKNPHLIYPGNRVRIFQYTD